MVQPLGIKFSLQSLQNPQRAMMGARRGSFGLSLCADEYVLMKRFHVRSPQGILDFSLILSPFAANLPYP
jgi:hypothetical protein